MARIEQSRGVCNIWEREIGSEFFMTSCTWSHSLVILPPLALSQKYILDVYKQQDEWKGWWGKKSKRKKLPKQIINSNLLHHSPISLVHEPWRPKILSLYWYMDSAFKTRCSMDFFKGQEKGFDIFFEDSTRSSYTNAYKVLVLDFSRKKCHHPSIPTTCDNNSTGISNEIPLSISMGLTEVESKGWNAFINSVVWLQLIFIIMMFNCKWWRRKRDIFLSQLSQSQGVFSSFRPQIKIHLTTKMMMMMAIPRWNVKHTLPYTLQSPSKSTHSIPFIRGGACFVFEIWWTHYQ